MSVANVVGLPDCIIEAVKGALITRFVGPTVDGVLLALGMLLGVLPLPLSSNSIV
jgi:hypothetical protein